MTDVTELDEAAIRARLEAARPGLPAAVARVAINRDGTCDGCAQSKHLVASYPEPDSEPWLCAECAADVDFAMFAPLDIGLLLTALGEARERAATWDEVDRLSHENLLKERDNLRAQAERLHFDLDREARARQAAEGALAAVNRYLADYANGTRGAIATLASIEAALATPTTPEESNQAGHHLLAAECRRDNCAEVHYARQLPTPTTPEGREADA